MSQNSIHITKEGDRWDLLAWTYYRDTSLMGLLIESNPHLPIVPVLPSGQKVLIPLIEKPANTKDLPPWKQ